jgi:hypothetical protein
MSDPLVVEPDGSIAGYLSSGNAANFATCSLFRVRHVAMSIVRELPGSCS